MTRCTTRKPSPYLFEHWPIIADHLFNAKRQMFRLKVVDLGGGNGRNLELVKDRTQTPYTTLLDKEGDYGVRHDLVWPSLPFTDGFADLVLFNYVSMFVVGALPRILREVNRIASSGCVFVHETQWLPGNKETAIHTPKQAAELNDGVINTLMLLNWAPMDITRHRCILRKR